MTSEIEPEAHRRREIVGAERQRIHGIASGSWKGRKVACVVKERASKRQGQGRRLHGRPHDPVKLHVVQSPLESITATSVPRPVGSVMVK